MLFHENLFDLFELTSFFAWTFFLARCDLEREKINFMYFDFSTKNSEKGREIKISLFLLINFRDLPNL